MSNLSQVLLDRFKQADPDQKALLIKRWPNENFETTFTVGDTLFELLGSGIQVWSAYIRRTSLDELVKLKDGNRAVEFHAYCKSILDIEEDIDDIRDKFLQAGIYQDHIVAWIVSQNLTTILDFLFAHTETIVDLGETGFPIYLYLVSKSLKGSPQERRIGQALASLNVASWSDQAKQRLSNTISQKLAVYAEEEAYALFSVAAIFAQADPNETLRVAIKRYRNRRPQSLFDLTDCTEPLLVAFTRADDENVKLKFIEASLKVDFGWSDQDTSHAVASFVMQQPDDVFSDLLVTSKRYGGISDPLLKAIEDPDVKFDRIDLVARIRVAIYRLTDQDSTPEKMTDLLIRYSSLFTVKEYLQLVINYESKISNTWLLMGHMKHSLPDRLAQLSLYKKLGHEPVKHALWYFLHEINKSELWGEYQEEIKQIIEIYRSLIHLAAEPYDNEHVLFDLQPGYLGLLYQDPTSFRFAKPGWQLAAMVYAYNNGDRNQETVDYILAAYSFDSVEPDQVENVEHILSQVKLD
jgi:hypothetical protein